MIEQFKDLLQKHKNNNITIVDDIDLDGMAGAIIVYNYLLQLGYKNLTVLTNTTHGEVYNLDIQQTDLLIIIDSSTNDIEYFTDKPYDVIIIDHHTKTNVNTYPILQSNTVLNINSLDFEEYKYYSSAMLTYTLLNKVFGTVHNDYDLHTLAYLTYFTDMVEMDSNNIQFIRQFESKFKVSKNSTLRTLASTLNKLRKLASVKSIDNLFYTDLICINNPIFQSEIETLSKSVSGIHKFIKTKVKASPSTYIKTFGDSIELINLTPFKPFTKDDTLKRIKGSMCSILSTKPITFTYIKEGNTYQVSCRSKYELLQPINELASTYNLPNFTGHPNAFGGEVDVYSFLLLLDTLSNQVHTLNSKPSFIESDLPYEELAYLNSIRNKDLLYGKLLQGLQLKELGYKINTKYPIQDDLTYLVVPERR